MPLVFSPDAYNFIYIKNIIFTTAVFLLFISFFFQKEPAMSHITLIPFIFIIWILIASLSSKYSYRGYEIFFTLMILYLFFAVVANIRESSLKNIKFIINISSILPILIGLVQAFMPGIMKDLMAFGDRIPSTLGNPNFFAGYLIAVLPVIFIFAFESTGMKRLFAGVLLLAGLICLIKTGSKAGFVGLSMEIAVFISIYAGKKAAAKRLALAGLIIAVLLISLGLIFKNKLLKNDSIFFRLYTWKGTLNIIKDHPLLGTGPGTFSIIYPEYRPNEIMKWAAQHSYEVTQPENILLQTASDTGLIGLGIFLLLLWIILKKAADKPWLLAPLTGIIATNLFGVDINYISTSAFFALYAGMALNGNEMENKMKKNSKYVLPAIGTVLFLFIIFEQFNTYTSSIYLLKAVNYTKTGDWNRAISDYDQAVKLDPHNLDAQYFLASAYYDSDKKMADKALAKFDELEKMAPDFILLHYKKGTIYFNTGEYDKAMQEHLKMLKIDPYFTPSLNELMWIFVNEKDYARAQKCMEQAIANDTTDPALYNNLGNIYMLQKSYSEAAETYKKAIDLRQDKDYYYNAGCAYYMLKDNKKARELLLKAKELDKTNDPKIIKMLERIK